VARSGRRRGVTELRFLRNYLASPLAAAEGGDAMGRRSADAKSPLEFHVLLALAAGPLHGYAIAESIATDSGGAVAPRAGSLYRVIARLLTAGQLVETSPRGEPPAHPGLARRYYALTAAGRRALAAEASRLAAAAAAARERLDPAEGRS
jgi:DNA-binding PadR family transcriptional regulator